MAAVITTILWDLDGTLINSEDIHNEAAIYATKMLNHPCNFTTFPSGIENKDIFALIFDTPLNGNNTKLFNQWERLVVEYAIGRITRNRQIVPAVNLFGHLTKLQMAQSVVSNSPALIIQHSLAVLGLSQLCSRIFSRDTVKQGKPNPALYLNAIAFHNAKPENCIAFEDSATGITAAKAAGISNIIGIGSSSSIANPSLMVNKEEDNWFSIIEPLLK